MLDYIIQVLLFQTLFLAVYDLLLKKETFFQWNRAYLLMTSVVAYCIPMLKISSIQQIVPQEYVILLPEVMLSPTAVIIDTFDWSSLFFNTLQWVFWIGIAIMIILFIIKLTNLIRLIHSSEKFSENKYQLVFLDSNKAFSFFKYIFLGKTLNEENKQQIIAHELVHVEQKHTLDLLFFELQKIVFWFNPFSYLFQQRISELHEYIADAKTVKVANKTDYFQHLLAQTFSTQKISFINSFFKISLIKKRILMLNKTKSKQLLKFKYVLMLPLLVSMLLYSSCENDMGNNMAKTESERRNTLIALMKDRINNKNATKEDLEYVKGLHSSFFDPAITGSDIKEKNRFLDILLIGKKYSDRVNELYPNHNGEYSLTQLEINDIIRSDDFKDIKSDDIPNLLQIIRDSVKDDEFDRHEKIKNQMYLYLLKKREGILGNIRDREVQIERNNNYDPSKGVPFAIITKPPSFPGCEDAVDQKQCFNLKMHQFVAANFDSTISNKLGLEPGKKKILVKFKIDTNGAIVDVEVRAPHPDLEKEAIRMMNTIPIMQPGEKENGEKIKVIYMLPIAFNIQ